MRLISIDPGYDRFGFAVIDKDIKGNQHLIFSGCIETNKKDSFEERLYQIGSELENIIKRHKPTALAIETLFFNTNQKTAMNVSQTRGMVLYIGKKFGLDLFEYTPLQIKVAITGYGRSNKDQIISMIPRLIKISGKIKYDDEWDAIAVGLTCFAHERFNYQ
ncbi:crossover junction endodeoxyribonuclease RuvC [Candidatus Campbellbacteria bacterium CG22_combo_CG10-13_8_21_14_all_36_13]|uniref:Crossover junction endodeoxyribonuclease RuvC n=1 Tax=Candidatus Campbellbacteria bacterium CG22_combo_CG10-13_8_21_14_all_36_13 TaxID=1974529 RepID=A0A2H0DZX4_9BACT|nr:MAG: crossover junction endodeoxyribonuclease RuvC [Candidatus Campbellbacteria bacterium CG22_combo_CG10-13_8_21_14_all_36_13]